MMRLGGFLCIFVNTGCRELRQPCSTANCKHRTESTLAATAVVLNAQPRPSSTADCKQDSESSLAASAVDQ